MIKKQKELAFKKNNSGQVTVEYILLAVTLLVLFQVASTTLRNNEALKEFQEIPQNVFQNMIANGNWELNAETSRSKHPNHYEFQYTTDGEGKIF